MNIQNVIGIDPDSTGFEIAFFNNNKTKPERKHFSISQDDLSKFLKLIKKTPDVIIAIEGHNGHSRPIEQVFRKENIIFYSFKPAAVNEFRKSVLGQNKNNKIDAEATARYAISLKANGVLENYKRTWFPDESLRFLTRLHGKRTKQKTSEVNTLWKAIHVVSPDLYLAIKGEKPLKNENNEVIQSNSLLSLLVKMPDIGEWKKLTDSDLLQMMDSNRSSKSYRILKLIKAVASSLSSISIDCQEILKHCAKRILGLKQEIKSLERLVEQNVGDDLFVNRYTEVKGIGVMTAAKTKAEMIDPRRYINDDNLASYSGLCLKDESTGNNKGEKPSKYYNHRLKNIFMTAVKNFIHFNPDSHLAGYYRNLIKHRKMKVIEARKRAARAFVRTVYKLWNSIIQIQYTENIKKEGNMAKDQFPLKMDTKSNILPSVLKFSTKERKKSRKKKENILT